MRKLMLGVCLAAASIVAAQEPPPSPSFEVATIKLNKSGAPNQFIQRQPGGRVTVTNLPARFLITFAYQLAQFQLVGGPAWMAADRFDMVAKLEGNQEFTPQATGPDPIQLAMRALLADRFKLKAHRETREMDIYALVMAKPGGAPAPGLKRSDVDCAEMARARRGQPPPQGPPPIPAGGGPVPCSIMGTPGMIRFGGFPISQITTMLGGMTGRMVVDRTGLTGNWEFVLSFAPPQGGPPPGAQLPPGVPAPDPDAPSIFTALQEQLGLKLESTKGPVEVTVIDAIEHPTED
jgi:bla regulator protein blaR1